MAYWVAGLLISLVYSMLNTEPEKKEKKLISETMSFRYLCNYITCMQVFNLFEVNSDMGFH